MGVELIEIGVATLIGMGGWTMVQVNKLGARMSSVETSLDRLDRIEASIESLDNRVRHLEQRPLPPPPTTRF